MSEDVYKRLREFLDAMPGGFPATDSGVETKILKKLYTPEEAEILSIPNDTEPSVDTTDTMQTGKILSQIAYVDAFDEVIRKQVL